MKPTIFLLFGLVLAGCSGGECLDRTIPGLAAVLEDGCGDDDATDSTPVDSDVDNDGYTAIIYGGDDCNDTDAQINPGEDETGTTCDGVDNDCDGEADNDAGYYPYFSDYDGDNYGQPGTIGYACTPDDYPPNTTRPSSGGAVHGDDCNDSNKENCLTESRPW